MAPAEDTPIPDSTLLKDLDDRAVTYLQQNLQQLISLMTDRIEYAETRRSVLAAVAGALLAGAVALLTVLPNVKPVCLWWGLLALSIGASLVALLVWCVYALQTNFKYPFTEVATTWKWYYHYALQDKSKFNTFFLPLQTQHAREESKTAFTQQWEYFRHEQIQGLIDARTNTMQDLRQVYLLHVNERYKNLFLTHLRNTLSLGLVITLVISFIVFLVAAAMTGST
jgi:hypothetical protein